MAYVLYADPTGIQQELYGCKAIPRQYLGNTQAAPRQSNMHSCNPCLRKLLTNCRQVAALSVSVNNEL